MTTKHSTAPRKRAAKADRRPGPARMTKARIWLEKDGGRPTFEILLKRLEHAAAKLDVVVDSYGADLANIFDGDIGAAVITTEIAQELDTLFAELGDWARSHQVLREARS